MQVGDQVVGVLQADGEAQGSGIDAGGLTDGFGHGIVGGGGRVADQSLRAPETDRKTHDPQGVQHAETFGLTAVQAYRESGAGSAALAGDQGLGRRLLAEADIGDAAHLGMIPQPCGDDQGVRTGPGRTQRQGFERAQQ